MQQKKDIMKFIILILFFIPTLLFSQGWERTFGGDDGDYGYSVQQTTDGGYIITGKTYSFGNGDLEIYFIKTDNNGDTLWTKTYGEYWDYGYSVQQTTDGGYIITGGTWSPGIGSSISLIKTDSIGDTLWTKILGGEHVDVGTSVQQTTDGGFVISGCTELSENSYYDVCLIKTDSNGDSLWTKTFGGEYLDVGYSVQQTTNGGYIVTGYTELSGNGDRDVYLIRSHINGDSLWTRKYGGDNEEEGYSVQQTTDGGYIITGYTLSFGNGQEDVYLIKTDNNGDTLWTKTFGGETIDIGK